MNKTSPFKNAAIAALAVILLPVMSAQADVITESIAIDGKTNQAAAQSQKKIDKVSERTKVLLDEYRTVSHQIESLLVYNQHLRDLIESQRLEMDSIKQQLKEIEVTQREIVPLMLAMLDNLQKFVTLDLPFLTEERNQRVAELKKIMIRADVTNAEKYRRILEAYQIENEYGNTIEAYRTHINLNGKNSAVECLRLGRVSLYYQRLDGSETGYWDKESSRWKQLDSRYNSVILEGLRIARKEAAPNLLTLPIPAAEAGQ
ncbi:MAG: DUF3450 domain-containing protein [Methylococcales bacterium]|jgi:chromosome segregation ATPase|nr:DUF3450 domain-containing protein [Methylococcales bacterium]